MHHDKTFTILTSWGHNTRKCHHLVHRENLFDWELFYNLSNRTQFCHILAFKFWGSYSKYEKECGKMIISTNHWEKC